MQSRNGAVASPHYLASVAGLNILQNGGSAVDAAIAINSTLGVVYPHMTGIGGDAFWLVYDASERKVHALNGTGRSSRNATRDFYHKQGHSRIPERGPFAAVTVPGACDSWCKAHERFGKLGLAEILNPAITYARDGFPVTSGQAHFTSERFDILSQTEATRKAYLPGDDVPETGSLMRLPQLAETLQNVAANGRAGFYEGPVADEIVSALNAAGNYWDKSDLADHHGTWGEPIKTTYRGLTACQHPPNSQGFVHLMLLNVLEQFDLSKISDISADYVHLIVEACKLIFEDRDRYLTDPDHCDIPMEQLLSKDYAKELAGRIRMENTGVDERKPMGQDTTCTVVVDAEGNAVSIIQSIYHEFGSAFVAGESGVLLQNRGSFFSLDESHVRAPRFLTVFAATQRHRLRSAVW
jgi:gamma-glutamyltranspeptidase/glutathione hydrolase